MILMKNILWLVLMVFFILSVSFSFSLITYSQSIVLNQSKVIYELPYPGILPDHPLYLLKATRDKMLDVFTRDNIKKAELYLLLSDKRTAMAISLVKKGKDKLALTTMSKAEKYFLKILPLLKASKKQGVNPQAELINKLKLSNAKHKEIIEDLIKDLPQGQTETINEIMRINEEINKEISSW